MGAPYRTIEELKHVFRVSDNRTINSAFAGNIKVVDDTLCVESAYLIKRFGFDPQEPFLTRNEVLGILSIDHEEFDRLVRYGHLPVFSLQNKRGSATLILKRDLENFNTLFVHYSNNVPLLISHHNRIAKFMRRLFERDCRVSMKMVENKRDLDIVEMHFCDNLSYTEIANHFNCSKEAIRQRLDRCITRFDSLMDYIDSAYTEQDNLRAENEKLQKENRNLIGRNQVLMESQGHHYLLESISKDNINQIDICAMLRSLQWEEAKLSVRLFHFLKGMQLLWEAEHRTSDDAPDFSSSLQWLLDINVNELYKYRGMGARTESQFLELIESIGFAPNKKAKFKINPKTVMNNVVNLDKFLEYYKEKRGIN